MVARKQEILPFLRSSFGAELSLPLLPTYISGIGDDDAAVRSAASPNGVVTAARAGATDRSPARTANALASPACATAGSAQASVLPSATKRRPRFLSWQTNALFQGDNVPARARARGRYCPGATEARVCHSAGRRGRRFVTGVAGPGTGRDGGRAEGSGGSNVFAGQAYARLYRGSHRR